MIVCRPLIINILIHRIIMRCTEEGYFEDLIMRNYAELCSLQTVWVFKYAVLLRKICGAQVKHLLF